MNNVTLEAERQILSCILTFGINDICVSKGITELEADDFSEPCYKEIFVACSKLYYKNINPDIVTVCDNIDKALIETVIGLNDAITSANMSYYIKLIKSHRQRERIAKRIKKAFEGDDILTALEGIAHDERNKIKLNDFNTITNANLAESVRNICSPLDNSKRIPTGHIRLDRTLGKLEKGTVSLIGAYPSGGKTAFALNIINYNLKNNNNKCLLFSLEMSTGQIFERLAADRCSIDYGNIRSHFLKDKDKENISLYFRDIAKKQQLIIIDDIYYAEEIVKAIAEVRPDYVVIDFIHCVRSIKRCESRRTEIDYISQCFKECAKRYNVHIIILCQVARPEKGRERAPKMSDLKESGGLEQDGDYIIMLHRPYVLDKSQSPCEAEILLDKNKYGDTGKIGYTFKGQYQRFVENVY